MNKKVSPALAILVIVLAVGAAFGIMYAITERRPPHLPIGMGQAMGEAGANQKPTPHSSEKGQPVKAPIRAGQ